MDEDPLTNLNAARSFTVFNRFHTDGRSPYAHEPYPVFHFGKRTGQPRCWGQIGSWQQCRYPGKVKLADGSTWCGVHAPKR
jgi:hypothetical protein